MYERRRSVPFLTPLSRLALVLILTAPARAQMETKHPSDEGGFKPGQSYQLGEIDDVNLFNGNLTLTIPLGVTYPVGPGLSYQFKLTYSTASWLTETLQFENPEEPDVTISFPDRYNAGFGWNLSFGYLTNPSDQEENPILDPDLTLYFDPNGGQHSFYETLHAGDGNVRSDYGYTRDSTYLRLRVNPAGEPSGTRFLEFPDGTIHVFDLQGRIREIRNQFSNVAGGRATTNFIRFEWTLNDPHCQANKQDNTKWTISDSQGRTHDICFVNNGATDVIDRIELENPDERVNAPATYTLGYHQNGPQTIRQPFPADDEDSPDQTVDLLTEIQQPDGSRWIPGDYILDAKHITADPGVFVLNGKNLSSGFLRSLVTPLGATMSWDYTIYRYRTHGTMPLFTVSGGIASKTVTGSALAAGMTWTYVPKFVTPNQDLRQNEFHNTVTDPLGHQTKHYFNIASPVETYGLPYSPYEPVSGRFLSSEVFRAGSAAKVRSSYVLFEWEEGQTRDRNRILKAERTVFDDDPEFPGGPARVVDVDRFLPDGRGHFRRETTAGSTGPGREVITEYSTGTPSPLSRWVLNTYSEIKRSQSGKTFRELYCFNDRGFLNRKRWIKDTSPNPAAGNRDIIRVFVPDEFWFVDREQLHGGDLREVPTTTGCGDTLTAWEREIFHDYEGGVRKYSQTTGVNFAHLDLRIGRAGLPTSSKDPSKIETSYVYDAMGRPVSIQTGDHGPLHIAYHPEDPSVVARRFKDNGSTLELSHEKVIFDALGRPFRSLRQRDGDDAFDETMTTFDRAGNMDFRSEMGRQGDNISNIGTHYRFYDPFGRPGEVETADGSKSTLTYRGNRWVLSEMKLGTSQDAEGNTTLQNVLRVETYDPFGRLDGVQEEIGTVATYTYDAMDHLVGVNLYGPGGGTSAGNFVSQDREFGYDGRGFLRWEKHPEKQTNTFTPWDVWTGYSQDSHVDYLDFNTLGQAGLRVDGDNHVRFKYDLAGRPTDVILEKIGSDNIPDRPLKRFTYGDSTNPGNRNLGKVTMARRWNYPRLATPTGTVQYAQSYIYDYVYAGRNGGLSKRDTSAKFNVLGMDEADADEKFTQSWTWDEAGRPLSIGYPQCTFAPCNGLRSSSFTDVQIGHPYAKDIEAIVGAGLTIGCGGNQYCPNDVLTRAQAATFIMRGIDGFTYQAPACGVATFNDVSCAHWAAPFIYDMARRGITVGCSTTPSLFCPENPVKRAEVAVFLLRARYGAGYTPPNCSSSEFDDVTCGVELGNWIEQARKDGLVEGRLVRGADSCGGSASVFCPNSNPTRAEMASLLRKGFQFALPANDASPRVARNVYEDGFLTEVSPFAGISYHPNGLVKSVNMSNGDAWFQDIAAHRMPRPSAIRLNFGSASGGLYYSYDGAGNVIRVRGGSATNAPAEKYLYDSSSRLVRGALSNGVAQTFIYDGFGNIHRITSNDDNPNTGESFGRETPTDSQTNRLKPDGGYAAYDRSGNQTRLIATSYEYDGLNMLTRVTGAEDWQFLYDADDERLNAIRISPSGRFDRFTLRDLGGKVLRTWEAQNWTWTKPVTDHVYRGDRLLATVWMANGEGTKFLFPDHLGSPRIVRQVSNGAAREHHYMPFGEEFTAADGERMKFTGHERDGLTTPSPADDLDSMHARHYNPQVARFLSPDPFLASLAPQAWNRYTYCSNNPLNFIDPMGLSAQDPYDEILPTFYEEVTLTVSADTGDSWWTNNEDLSGDFEFFALGSAFAGSNLSGLQAGDSEFARHVFSGAASMARTPVYVAAGYAAVASTLPVAIGGLSGGGLAVVQTGGVGTSPVAAAGAAGPVAPASGFYAMETSTGARVFFQHSLHGTSKAVGNSSGSLFELMIKNHVAGVGTRSGAARAVGKGLDEALGIF